MMKLKDILFLVFMGILAGCALVFTGLIVKDRLVNSRPSPQTATRGQNPSTHKVEGWKDLQLDGYRSGPAEASVRIVEFFDYQCPFCKRAKPAVEAIQNKYPQKVSVIYENNPLPMHEHARKAAIAAECVHRISPDTFMAYHDSLFAHQQRLGEKFYSNMAKAIEIADFPKWQKCVEEKQTTERVESGKKLAGKLGIRGIPTFLVNGMLVTGVLSKQKLDHLVQEELAKISN